MLRNKWGRIVAKFAGPERYLASERNIPTTLQEKSVVLDKTFYYLSWPRNIISYPPSPLY
jgi:hypothetical protein